MIRFSLWLHITKRFADNVLQFSHFGLFKVNSVNSLSYRFEFSILLNNDYTKVVALFEYKGTTD